MKTWISTAEEVQSLAIILLFLLAMNLSMLLASSMSPFPSNIDRLALLEFKHQISDDPYGVLNSWNDSQHYCQWQGVTCDARHQRVTALNLSGNSLLGSISPHIGNLSFVKFIKLNENRFYGGIPQDVGRLSQLTFLNLSSNTLSGEIPVNLSQCLELSVLSLFRNQLVGKIPPELGSLKNLENLYLFTNNLTGEIPRSIGNLSSLTILSLSYNNLEGNLPKEIGFLTKLYKLAIGVNQLSGEIPPEVYNNSSIAIFSVTSNKFHGTIPEDLDLTLPNLQKFQIYGNQFSGNIPARITNLSKLTVLEVGSNNLQGQVPNSLGNLPKLELFNIEVNLFGSNSAGDLSFIASLTNCSNLQVLAFDENNFGGQLPNVIGNLSSQLTEVYMNLNHISGDIPIGFGRLVNLFVVDMEQNSFTGGIPSDFEELQNLQYLSLDENFLSGQIPSNLCNITSLYSLFLSNNSFHGDISLFLQNCRYLKELDISENNFTGVITSQTFGMLSSTSLVNVALSHNSLSGSLPIEVGKLINLHIFDVSYNKFSGQIPATLAGCSGLEHLNMQGNFFQGMIPPNFASLKVIQSLDLSSNNLTGQVPGDLQYLTFLNYLNLSFNDLEGEIPTAGVFGNASQIILVGNGKLCGGIPQLGLPPCLIKRRKQGHHLVTIVIPTVVAVFTIAIAFVLCYVMYQKRYKRRDSSTMPSEVGKILRTSYHELYRATDGFSSTNLIGSGSFGFVYKGRLDQHSNRIVAIKVLDIQKNGASKSFKAECKALRNIRHRNLVSLLTYCSSIDFKGHEFKALVYAFMENGSLDRWLHPEVTEATSSRNLNLLQRLNIAIDVASALDYLHNHSEVAVVHCDLKPSNILLNNELTAHVGDFGLAKLFPRTTNYSSQQGTSSTIALKGSIGYAAPEYAMGVEVSTEGDVYSYGILLLEMFTGRKPTDGMFIDELDLHNYVKIALPEQVWKIVDPSLLSREVEQHREEVQSAAAEVPSLLSREVEQHREEVQSAAAEVEEIDNGNRIEETDNGNNIGDLLDETNMNVAKSLISVFKVGLGCSQRSPKERIDMKEVTRELHHIREAYSCIC